jgi:hypothetical protein
MARTTDGFTWMDITGEGLACTNFIGVGVTEINSDYIFCGAMDGNINFYNEGEWFETRPGGDNGDVLIDPTNITRVYQQYQSTLKRTTVTGNNTNDGTSISPPAGNGWLFPMIMNPNNSSEIFAGTHGLHFTSNADANLGVTWATIPTPNPFYANNKTSSVAMSANNSDVVYYSVRGYWHEFPTTLPDGSLNTDNFGAIYRAERIINGNWVVTDITNNIRTRCVSTVCGLAAPISDIAVDPNDEDNIWVTLGSFSDGDKVFNTTDGGANWVNVSSCLPNIPMTAVVVQGGSNNRAYVGSDYGVFYKDNTMTDWAHYGNNGPKSVVYDMEINYCGNKIVVGTHGRGLWEADLINSEDDAVTLGSGTTNWTTPKSLYYDHIIPQGTTLNITGTKINIAEGVKIIVKKGATLNINNSTLTNGCGDLWQGIEVHGLASEHQSSAQGRLLVGNSTIEYAKNAVLLGEEDDSQLTKTGGFIYAWNTTFRNNERAVEFLKYRNFNPNNPSITWNNASSFSSCTFITDEDLPDNLTPSSFVKMWVVDGIKFYNCDFMNINPNANSLEKLGRGIHTFASSFTVTGCTSACPITGSSSLLVN